jgi:glucose-6-phosphate 1-dehydrogenase
MVMSSSQTLLLFGATGDLAKRMLLPSLYGLDVDGLLPPAIRIVGTARSAMSGAEYRVIVGEALTQYLDGDRLKPDQLERFLDRIDYVGVDASDPAQFAALADVVGDPSAGLSIFLSTAPSLFGTTIAGLQAAGLAGESVRIGLEKPLGYDLASSRVINDAVASAFPEGRTFRIDHYLGKETVQNLLALRFGNVLFEPLWNAAGIDHVQISVAETVGLEGRIGFYNEAGAVRDMVQNHMLQLLALVAMEPPATFEAKAVRDEKVKVLRRVRAWPRIPSRGNMARVRLAGQRWLAILMSLAKRRTPRRSWRSRRTLIIGAGKTCHSTCARASGSPLASLRYSFSLSRCRTISSPGAGPMRCPIS